MKTANWLATNSIALNDPLPPNGFQKFRDCDSGFIYKKRSGDTIFFYLRKIAEPTKPEKLAQMQKRVYFNRTVYPQKIQEDGSILLTRMEPETFLLRHDSLYLLDNTELENSNLTHLFNQVSNSFTSDPETAAANLFQLAQNNAETYQDSLEMQNFTGPGSTWLARHPPYFKLLFHKDLFTRSRSVVLQRKPFVYTPADIPALDGKPRRPVRSGAPSEERVDLVKAWKQNGKDCYLIRFYSHSIRGLNALFAQYRDFIFMADGTFLQRENCQLSEKAVLASLQSVTAAETAGEGAQVTRKKMIKDSLSGTAKEETDLPEKTTTKTDSSGAWALVTLEGKQGIINKRGNIVVPAKYNSISPFSPDGLALVSVYENYVSKFGYIDRTGKEVVPLVYEKAEPFSEGRARVTEKDRGEDTKWGFIDAQGRVVIPFRYTVASEFYEGRALVKLNNRTGFIDKEGKEVIPLQYDNALWFQHGRAVVFLNGKAGIIDREGKEIVPFRYDNIFYFQDGTAQINYVFKEGIIDVKSGGELVPAVYDKVGEFREGLAPVVLYNKYGFVDRTGREVVPLKYEQVNAFSEGLAPVMLQGKAGFVDKEGNEVISLKYDLVTGFHAGLAGVYTKGKAGLIDHTGREMIPPRYDQLGNFENGLSRVVINKKYGLINKAGQEITPVQYDFIGNFYEGLAAVTLNGQVGFIDTSGKEVVPLIYEYATAFSQGLAAVSLKRKWGFIDKKGAAVIPFTFDHCSSFAK
ncbi:MAG: WG repeat-containing protein [Williamsia sp.]|nr:WG repeat-containing protein [Williamsia sp.]